MQAGYKIAAFDIFNDVETRRLSLVSEQVCYGHGGFDADDLWNKLTGTVQPDTVVAYGSGLESQPELLEKIAGRFRLAGNPAEVVARAKQPGRFFGLLDALGVPYPEVCLDDIPCTPGWLAKKTGGSGGTHIRRYEDGEGDYYQRFVAGTPVSVLFLADGCNIEVIGYNEQWTAPVTGMPFRYGGIVGNADFSARAKSAMAEAASKVAGALGLRGVNSMDFILTDAEELLALEVNPRLSASFDLYVIPELFERHLQAGRNEPRPLLRHLHGSKAMLIHYANCDVDVPEMEWPAWIVDRPVPGVSIKAGDPVCTIVAQARDAAAAKALVFARASELDAQLQTLSIPPGK